MKAVVLILLALALAGCSSTREAAAPVSVRAEVPPHGDCPGFTVHVEAPAPAPAEVVSEGLGMGWVVALVLLVLLVVVVALPRLLPLLPRLPARGDSGRESVGDPQRTTG